MRKKNISRGCLAKATSPQKVNSRRKNESKAKNKIAGVWDLCGEKAVGADESRQKQKPEI
jgi:hypothetical protein